MNSKESLNRFQFLLGLLLLLFSCNNDHFEFEKGSLSLKMDTLKLDTILSNKLCSPKKFAIFNNSEENIRLSEIVVVPNKSEIVLSVNGKFSENNRLEDVEVFAKDSVICFVQVRAESVSKNFQESVSQILIGNKVLYLKSNLVNNVLLTQKYLDEHKRITKGTYLMMDSLVVEEDDSLVIDPGVEFYTSKFARLKVYGTLLINGTKKEPVQFHTDRIETANGDDEYYEKIPKLWYGIEFKDAAETHSYINYAILENSSTAFYIENSKVHITNSSIYHSRQCIKAKNSSVVLYNSVLSNFVIEAIQVDESYFYIGHTTISRRNNSFTQFLILVENKSELDQVTVKNSILVGKCDEVTNLSRFAIVNNCLVQNLSESHFMINGHLFDSKLDLFVNEELFDYHLHDLSQAKSIGIKDKDFDSYQKYDKDKMLRFFDATYDLGAYEIGVK